jgi:hypothetical protein
MRTFPLAALVVVAGIAIGCSGDSATDPPIVDPLFSNTPEVTETTVVGQGDPVTDFSAVQSAVNTYDRVFLSGTFDFGTDNVIVISRNVEIIGDPPIESGPTDPVTGNRDRIWPTKIRGGGAESRAVIWSDEKVDIVIKNIHFDQYQSTAISIRKASYAEINSCKITNGKPEVLDLLPIYNSVLGLAIGGSPTLYGEVDFPTVDNAVIVDNVVSNVEDGLPYDKPLVLSFGIGMSGMLDGTREVRGNLVKNYSHLGIYNTTGGTTIIENNRVIGGNRGDGIGYQMGIAPDWYGRRYFVAPVPLGNVFVRDNAIETQGAGASGVIINNWPRNPLAEDSEVVIEGNEIQVDAPAWGGVAGTGLVRNVTVRENTIVGSMLYGIDFVAVEGSTVMKNTIELSGGIAGITVWGNSTEGSFGNIIKGNTITGSAEFGLVVGDHGPFPVSGDNTFQGNDLSGLSTDYGGWVDERTDGNQFVNNVLGPAPLVLAFGSQYNSVVAAKDGSQPNGFDVCNQVMDLNTWYSPFTTTNIIPGYNRCSAPGAEVVQQVQARIAEKRLEKERAQGEPRENHGSE